MQKQIPWLLWRQHGLQRHLRQPLVLLAFVLAALTLLALVLQPVALSALVLLARMWQALVWRGGAAAGCCL